MSNIQKITGLLLFILISTTVFSQKKNDNTIVIDTAVSMDAIKMILFNNGYTIESADNKFLQTHPKTVTGAVAIKLNIAITDTGIVLKAQQKILIEMVIMGSPVKNEFQPVFMWKIKSSPYHDSWKEMDRVGSVLGEKRRYYKI